MNPVATMAITRPTIAFVMVDLAPFNESGEPWLVMYCIEPKIMKPTAINPEGLVTQITQTIIYITGAISVIMIVIGGLKYVFSAGDSAGVQSAKNTILYAIIGLVVTLFAQVIVSFVLSKL